jgi:group I intron endonuclease
MQGIIYRITNIVTGMSYIGQTVQTLRERWVEHVSHAKTGTTQSYIARAIKKYGPEAFIIEVLNVCLNHEALDAVETLYIKVLNTKVPVGYNLADGGGGVSGWKNGKGNVPTAETRKKLSEAGKGNTNALGKKYSKDFRIKVSAALKRRVRRKESYEKMAETRRSHKRPLTEKQIAANSARKGQPWTEARRAAQKSLDLKPTT